MDCGQDIVLVMTGKLSGGAGPSGVDGLVIGKWFLDYRRASQVLHEELAEWINLLANESPPWAMHRVIMACRLTALNTQPSVCHLGINKVWRRAIAKCVLMAAGDDTKAACGSSQ